MSFSKTEKTKVTTVKLGDGNSKVEYVTEQEMRFRQIEQEIKYLRHSLTIAYIILFLDVIIRWLK